MDTAGWIDHAALSVTDLDRSERFYTTVLDFVLLVDFGYARSFVHRPTGFLLALVRHPDGDRAPFSELRTGLDHLGLTASSREELVGWETRLGAAGVPVTPIRDMPFGAHLNFRDPDGIPLEFSAPSQVLLDGLREVRKRDLPPEEIRARVAEHLRAWGVPESELPRSREPA